MKAEAEAMGEVAEARKEFASHLKRLKRARRLADKASKKSDKTSTMAEATIEAAWELLFDLFYRTEPRKFGLADLNTLSGVIHKLVASECGAKANALKFEAQAPRESGVSAERLREIENRLKLL